MFVVQDLLLAELLTEHKEWIVQYHEHDSLLENRPEEHLSEAERLAAWEEFERERHEYAYQLSNNRGGVTQPVFGNQGYMFPNKIRYITGPPQSTLRQNFVPIMQPVTLNSSGVGAGSSGRLVSKMDDASK